MSKINRNNPISSNNSSTVIERVESVKFEETLTQMIDHKEVIIPVELEESPILLLIIHESGLGVYSKEYSMKSSKEQLISGIITAINALLQDVFEVGGTIERIRYKDFRLVIKGIIPLLFVYVFKGHSYLPIKKLEKFIEDLENTYLWEVFYNVSKKGTLLSDTDNQVIDDFTKKYFLDGSD